MKILRFGKFHDVSNYVVILQEGEIHLVPNCFSKIHIGVTVSDLLNSLLSGILSHGYVKDILGYNNFMQISD